MADFLDPLLNLFLNLFLGFFLNLLLSLLLGPLLSLLLGLLTDLLILIIEIEKISIQTDIYIQSRRVHKPIFAEPF